MKIFDSPSSLDQIRGAPIHSLGVGSNLKNRIKSGDWLIRCDGETQPSNFLPDTRAVVVGV